MAVKTTDTVWKIVGCVRHYAWGGRKFIPAITCLANEEEQPYAELWYGQHPDCPSTTTGGSSLAELMASRPEKFLTPEERNRWEDRLPYLCKILDVDDMLSIQIHPDKTQAEAGYHSEDDAGIPLTAVHRTFRDRNHKPELMFALSEFYLLHDFRPETDMLQQLASHGTLEKISSKISDLGLPAFFNLYMTLSQDRINNLLRPFVTSLLEKNIPEEPENPDYWARRAVDRFCSLEKIDRGILAFYLLNLIRLSPGDVVFQDNGIPHAYLSGQNIEVMSNSDNVIRGGLTSKYIDSAAMSDLVRYDKRQIHRLFPTKIDDTRVVFTPPIPEFNLSVIDLKPYQEYEIDITGISILFSTVNCFMIRTLYQELRISGGEAALARAGESLVLMCRTSAQIFLVSTQGAEAEGR